ncbi:hypothetical protein OIV19_18350 [Brucella sp. HL-2]|nr:hypothetical protein [Brucella sp. HL-2]MCV9909565.1 hypothetical protein [Brucella sp. HL-2]
MSNANNLAADQPPPIAPLMRMLEMRREILSTSHKEVSAMTGETATDEIYGAITLEKENLVRAEIVTRIMLDLKVANSMSTLFERYRDSF